MIYDYIHIYSYNYRFSNLSSPFQILKKTSLFSALRIKIQNKDSNFHFKTFICMYWWVLAYYMTKVVALQHCTLKTQQSQGFLFVTFFLISVTNITNSLFPVSQKSSEKASELSHIQIRSYECSICLFFILVRFFIWTNC